MLVREEKTYYYAAYIWREQRKVLRQGTINAESPLEGIDRVYEIGKTQWKRTVLEVTIMDPVSGEMLATSKIGEKVEKNLIGEHAANDEPTKGFVPWNKPSPPAFAPIDIGSVFIPVRFNKLTGL